MTTPTARDMPAAPPTIAADQPAVRTASCPCGALKATVSGPPDDVYLCCCLECQRQSGGAFTYSAWYHEAAVTIDGNHRSWRRSSNAGRWSETSFCQTCGTSVFGRVEASPGMIGVSVGCFADPAGFAPGQVFWASRKPDWVILPHAAHVIDQQPG